MQRDILCRMYASHGFLRSDIGDVDVVYHDGVFHLFHLVLPNHDFIAHAISRDGLTWRRVANALFVAEPGSWDDDMLWTMHVTPDPEKPGSWRMFYTGLARAEFGRVQRVGMATSDDLFNWTRCDTFGFPLEVSGEWYESRADEGRKWVSFRDPFFFSDPASGERLLLSSARVNHGPLIRRGCVGLARETEPGTFVFGPPLHRPGLYDDVEVPNLVHLDGRYYLIGSVREDTKIHYWHSETLEGPYENFSDNVLLPRGNYAARICRLDGRILVFNFFQRKEYPNGRETITRLLPPPKELTTDKEGRLVLQSYRGFDGFVRNPFRVTNWAEFHPLFGNPFASIKDDGGTVHLHCPSGFEAFLLPGEHEDFRLRARMELEGPGKCGMVVRISEEGDGYFLSLDLEKGYAQLRRWGANPRPEFEHAFQYETLQSGTFLPAGRRDSWDLQIVAHGMYVEVSINGQVTLCVVDEAFATGQVGFYTESAQLRVDEISLERLNRPVFEEDAVYTSTLPHDGSMAPMEGTHEPPLAYR